MTAHEPSPDCFSLRSATATWASFVRLCTKSLCYTLLCVKYIWVSFPNCTAFRFYGSDLMFVSCSTEGCTTEEDCRVLELQTPPHPLSFHPCPSFTVLRIKSCLSFQMTEVSETLHHWAHFLILNRSRLELKMQLSWSSVWSAHNTQVTDGGTLDYRHITHLWSKNKKFKAA